MKAVHVVGYYFRDNLGDEQYLITMKLALEAHFGYNSFCFWNIDDPLFQSKVFQSDDILILGGGDVLIDYFLDRLQNLPNPKPILIAYSVGIPYLSVLDHPILERFTHIYLRTLQDIPLLNQIFKGKVSYIPDTSEFLVSKFKEPRIKMSHLLVNLNGHDLETFDCPAFLQYLKTFENKNIVFLPMCTDEKHSDTKLHEKVIALMDKDEFKPYLIQSNDLALVISWIKNSSIVVVARFHALVFSNLFKVNTIVCLSKTRKTKNYIKDHQLQMNCTVKHFFNSE